MSDLKQCPFCGGAPETIEPMNPANPVHCRCGGCGVGTMTAELWNTRAIPELPAGYTETEEGDLECDRLPADLALLAFDTVHGFAHLPHNVSRKHFQALAVWLQRRVSE